MSKPSDLTSQALQGYKREEVHYAYSSASWYAYHLGVFLRNSGMPAPRAVGMSRGYSVRCDGAIFKHLGKSNGAELFSVADEMPQPKAADLDIFSQNH